MKTEDWRLKTEQVYIHHETSSALEVFHGFLYLIFLCKNHHFDFIIFSFFFDHKSSRQTQKPQEKNFLS